MTSSATMTSVGPAAEDNKTKQMLAKALRQSDDQAIAYPVAFEPIVGGAHTLNSRQRPPCGAQYTDRRATPD